MFVQDVIRSLSLMAEGHKVHHRMSTLPLYIIAAIDTTSMNLRTVLLIQGTPIVVILTISHN